MEIKYIVYLIFAFMLSSCNNGNESVEDSGKKDTQENQWMLKWLKVETFKNGDSILFCQDELSWSEACSKSIPAYCKSADKSVYYYNIHCVLDQRGIAPDGYKVPSVTEVEKLFISKFIYKPSNPIYKSFEDPNWIFLTELRSKSKFDLFPGGCRINEYTFDNFEKRRTGLWTTSTFENNLGEIGGCKSYKVYFEDVYEGWCQEFNKIDDMTGLPILCLKTNSHDKSNTLILDHPPQFRLVDKSGSVKWKSPPVSFLPTKNCGRYYGNWESEYLEIRPDGTWEFKDESGETFTLGTYGVKYLGIDESQGEMDAKGNIVDAKVEHWIVTDFSIIKPVSGLVKEDIINDLKFYSKDGKFYLKGNKGYFGVFTHAQKR